MNQNKIIKIKGQPREGKSKHALSLMATIDKRIKSLSETERSIMINCYIPAKIKEYEAKIKNLKYAREQLKA